MLAFNAFLTFYLQNYYFLIQNNLITNFNTSFNDRLIRVIIIFLSFNNKKFILAWYYALGYKFKYNVKFNILLYNIKNVACTFEDGISIL